ncbi:unnamed protein product [Paramecium primaurelia]|uniref:MSP domain-containing protein n=1 Tax=Paramecium primaurelia TaxID=5886 RepID=A0A8S1NAP4_PARPR|nr:unnamed protein product [Paramecium primaurelia]
MKETTSLKPVTQKKNKSNFLLEMNEKDKEINNQIIKNMNKRVNYLKNPRFKINKAPVLFSYINTKQDIVVEKDQITSFRVFPKQLIFREYMLNGMYEIDLYVTNATGTLQRIKVLPPEKKEFQIAAIKYPTKEDGFIAPGMSAILKVRFNPSSLAEFDDTIAVITEDHILKVPLLARKEPPQLDLPSQLDCQSCWIGDQVETRFVVKNSGGEAGYRFFINNQQDQQEEENYIQVGNFYLSPAEFFLHKGETQIIQAIFKPDVEGEVIENIILGCDNLTQATLKLIGRGNMVELGILGIDNINLENQEQLQKIFFNDPIPKVETSRQLKIRNKTSVKVKYHWYLQNDDKELKLEDEQNYYSIQPQEGYFQPNEIIDFKIFLQSEEYYPLFQTAYLIIDDIPFESIRNPPPNLRQQFENNTQSVAIGSNSIKPSITYFEFELISKSALGEVSVTPQFYKFPVPLCVNTLATYKFKLQTTSKNQMKYQINPLQLDYFYIQDKQGVINNEAEIVLGVQSSEVGHMKLEYRIDFDYANSILITVFAEVIAPIISVKQSWLNYGLIQTYSLESQELTINNLSPVPALIKAQSGSDQRLLFNKDQFEIKPNSSISFKVEFQSREAETYNDFLYFQVENGDCVVLDVFAEVQNPSVSLNRLSLNIDTLYCGNTYTFDQRAQQYIQLQNLGNISTPFEWVVDNEKQDKYLVQFEPKKGVLKPKTNQIIKFSIKPKEGGKLNELFVCEVQGLQYPLGFEMNTMIYGLSVEYELVDDSAHISSKTSVSSKSKSLKDSRKSLLKADTEIKNQQMDKLEFYNCTINQPKQAKFLIKNTSGIHTQFTLFMRKYQPHALEEQSTLFDDFDAKSQAARTIKFAESSISKSVSKKGKITQGGRPVVLLTNKIEKTHNFTSEAGLKLNKQKKMEHDQRVYLSNNLGIAVVFEPSSGTLNAYGSVVVQVTVFNDICGLFEDLMCCDIRGLPTKEFPIAIDIKGSPIVISPSQLGFNYKTDFPTFDLGTYMRNFGTISRDFRVMNTGPQDVELEWKIYNLGNSTISDYFDIKITEPQLGSDQLCDVQFIANEPPESKDGPFQVVPNKERIKQRKEKHFTLHFTTQDTGNYSACLVARPRLINQDKTIGEVAFYVKSETITPYLTFDKLEKLEGGFQVKFQKWSSGYNQKQEKKLVLVNRQKSSFVCTFEIEGPFKIMQTSTNSPQKYELGMKTEIAKTFNLVTDSHVELLVKFEGYQPNDPVNWPLTYKVYHHGSINIYYANGDKQQIQLEGILLRPFVHLNTSGIDQVEGPEVLDFGDVQEDKTIAIYLSNLSLVPAQWKLQHQKNPLRKNIVDRTMTLEDKEEMKKTDDPSVFEFQITEGKLDGPSTMVHTLPHATCLPYQITIDDIRELGVQPFKILIRFKPTAELLYKSKYRIKVQEGPSVDFILRGSGKDLIKRKV